MNIINEITNSQPLFAHAQGAVHETDKWKAIVDDVVSAPSVDASKIPAGITIISFFSGKPRMSLKEQFEISNVPVLNAVDKNLTYWKNTMKIKYLKQLDDVTTPYVLVLDGLDILAVNDLSPLLQRFQAFNCKLLYNASKLNYPHTCRDVENTTSDFRFLNAGAFIGETQFVKDFYAYLFKHEMYKEYPGYDLSEQMRVRQGRMKYEHNKEIKVDVDCQIFQTLNRAEFSYNGTTSTLTIQNKQ